MTTATPTLRNKEEVDCELHEHTFFHPKVDIFETNDCVTLVAELPGSSEDDTDITLERNVLRIRATKGLPVPTSSEPIYMESSSGIYERIFIISDAIDRDGIEATVKDGLLRLVLPKAKQAIARTVTVKAG